jgi:hypothetical protein
LSRLYFGRFSDVHIGGSSSNQAATLESQMIHPIQLLPGRTLKKRTRGTMLAKYMIISFITYFNRGFNRAM